MRHCAFLREATQKAMAMLFDCSADNIGLHLKNIYDTNELNKEATTEKISVVQQEGAREVRRNTLFYNLDAIISVGYRVNSIRATQFRQWCTYVIRQFSLRGYIIDKKQYLMLQCVPNLQIQTCFRHDDVQVCLTNRHSQIDLRDSPTFSSLFQVSAHEEVLRMYIEIFRQNCHFCSAQNTSLY